MTPPGTATGPPEHTALYDDRRSRAAFPEGYERHFWHRARVIVVLEALARYGATRVLDIGCGPGAYVRAVRQAGYDAFGCDPGHAGVAPLVPAHIHTGRRFEDLEASQLANVDVVLLLDVIEHLSDPQPLLATIRDRLPNLRTLVVTVPARPELWSELDRYAGHCRRYRRAELSSTLTRAGYVVRESRHLFRLLYPGALAFTWRRHLRRRITSPRWPTLHAVAGRLLATERHLLPDAWPGTSLVCIASPAHRDRARA
jgi:SAM-dependent methyltransferase